MAPPFTRRHVRLRPIRVTDTRSLSVLYAVTLRVPSAGIRGIALSCLPDGPYLTCRAQVTDFLYTDQSTCPLGTGELQIQLITLMGEAFEHLHVIIRYAIKEFFATDGSKQIKSNILLDGTSAI